MAGKKGLCTPLIGMYGTCYRKSQACLQNLWWQQVPAAVSCCCEFSLLADMR